MDEIQIFSSPMFGDIRTAGTAENPLFCLADLCRVLELQVTPTKNRLDPRGVNSIKVSTPVISQGRDTGKTKDVDMTFVNEKNLYKVIMRSDKPQAEQKPAVVFTDAVKGSESSCLVGELAKLIKQNGYDIGEKRLFKWLRENGYLGSHGERYNIPNQRWAHLFELKKGVRSGDNGVMHTTITTKVNGKGQVYFINLFAKKAGMEAAV